MCGRYFLTKAPKNVRTRMFPEDFPETRINPLLELGRYNIAPTQAAPVFRNIDGEIVASEMRWGFRPGWLKDPTRLQINARAETVFEKPMFRAAARVTRCLVPASGWYEWQAEVGGKQPYAFHIKEYVPFAMAGLWTHAKLKEGGQEESFLVLTTQANPFAAKIHNRMPVILSPEACRAWLDLRTSQDELVQNLVAYPGDDLQVDKVSKKVNSPNNNDAECLAAVTEE